MSRHGDEKGKRKRSSMAVVTGTLEDEKVLGRCHPEPFDRLRTGSAEESKAL